MDLGKTKPDLSHWDFAERFSGHDAAALILGIEPRESENELWRIQVITDRMRLHYRNAQERFKQKITGLGYDPQIQDMSHQIELVSVALNSIESDAYRFGVEPPIIEWLNDDDSLFDNQNFDRNSLVLWLNAIKMKSAYSFDYAIESPTESKSGHWPWGAHHTELLGHLEAAATKFWIRYDPTDISTAETNHTVAEWLQRERKVSKTMAEAIASMLRPDGLPTGPRK